ncbi:hypothetical protein QF117_11380 [Vibrio sp. YMD68]|uniref:hypothetical protein n=1 Tax=Vibrio sp. YMD68 TaxID=3042300 RepID=UPI00249C439D|nr:hypothetical protein [Vibrio sp. YMD68]WGW01382.1 hypothetical protein QF117_11380 [Vibrio sp. YMD68]
MPFKKDTKESFINKAKKRWGPRYSYSEVIYINSRTPVKILCNKHNHFFYQTPKAHFAVKHHCCPLCYKEVIGKYQNQWRKKYNNAIHNTKDFYREELLSVFR